MKSSFSGEANGNSRTTTRKLVAELLEQLRAEKELEQDQEQQEKNTTDHVVGMWQLYNQCTRAFVRVDGRGRVDANGRTDSAGEECQSAVWHFRESIKWQKIGFRSKF